MNVIGLSGHFHDSACCLFTDARIYAAEEERFTRRKHEPAIPAAAFRWCLRAAGLSITDVDAVAWFEDPRAKLERQLWSALRSPSGARPDWLYRLDADRPAREIREVLGWDGPIEVVGHHRSHAASAYYFSGFDEAAVLTIDGVGEWETTTLGRGAGDDLELLESVRFPHSIGLLYSALTAYLGFEVNDAEYKVMGLAPYGRPVHLDSLRQLVDVDPDGGFRLDLRFFDLSGRGPMYTDHLSALLGAPARQPEGPLDPFHNDVAASLQLLLEDLVLGLARRVHALTGATDLAMAGGVALNCVANGRIQREGPFDRVFVQPAASDAGGALGAAAITCVRRFGRRPLVGPMTRADLGPQSGRDEILRLLAGDDVTYHDHGSDEAELLRDVVGRLAAGQVVGWHHGAMEFGPRALGHRSILADPRRPEMRDRVNRVVKLREGFRPFAPSVLRDRAGDHFAIDHPMPFMLETCQVHGDGLPAITHVDGSARPQTVERGDGRYARLLAAFEAATGCPVLLNTSFNLRGEPIVCTPADSLSTFVRSGLDALVLEDVVIDRDDLPAHWLGSTTSSAPAGPPAVRPDTYTFI